MDGGGHHDVAVCPVTFALQSHPSYFPPWVSDGSFFWQVDCFLFAFDPNFIQMRVKCPGRFKEYACGGDLNRQEWMALVSTH